MHPASPRQCQRRTSKGIDKPGYVFYLDKEAKMFVCTSKANKGKSICSEWKALPVADVRNVRSLGGRGFFAISASNDEADVAWELVVGVAKDRFADLIIRCSR